VSSIVQNIITNRLVRESETRQRIEISNVVIREISGSNKFSIAFDSDDIAEGSKVIGIIPANKRVYKVTLEIIVAFDSILIDVGDSDAHGRLMYAAQNNPETPGFFYSLAEVDYAAATQLLIYFTGTSVTGSGKINIYYS